jgi:hypothetical protein
MRTHTCGLAAFTLTAALTFGAAAMAADLPKEGTYKGTYAAVGTDKATKIGTDRVLTVFDETGLQTTDGFLDHTTWHCWGTGDFTNGMGQEQGHCTATDLAGDKAVSKFVSEKHAIDQKSFSLSSTCEGGTGKFAGAICSETDMVQANEFPSPSEGTYVVWVTFGGHYKLPALTQ